MKDTLSKQAIDLLRKEAKEKHNFYTLKVQTGEIKGLIIKKASIVDRLLQCEFYRYDIDTESSVFISINKNMVECVNKEKLIDNFMNFIKQLPDYVHKVKFKTEDGETNNEYKVTPKMIRAAIFENIAEYFNRSLLNRLVPKMPIIFHEDTKECKYIYFKNNFIEISKAGFEIKDYKNLTGFIWANQRLNRDFVNNERAGNFEIFLQNVCGKKQNKPDWEKRLLSLKTIIGYTLHGYFDYKLYAVIFTDEKFSDSDEPNGRTGKTLLSKALAQILNANKDATTYTEINGKNFDAKDKHRYGQANADTKLININDLAKGMPFETFFNDITEDISIDKKNEKPFKIKSKIIISTNRTIKIYGESAIDRAVIFEFGDYYNSERSPCNEFNQWFFTKDWNEEEWGKFDTFIISCLEDYFNYGVIKPNTINFHRRTLIEHTSQEFIEWLDDVINTKQMTFPEANEIIQFEDKEDIEKKKLIKSFLENYPDFKNLKQKTFTQWLKQYSKDASSKIKEISKARGTESRSNSIDKVKFEYKS